MTIRELRDKYGDNLKARAAVNAAIRAELVGGGNVLDALGLLFVASEKSRRAKYPESEEIDAAYWATKKAADALGRMITEKYNLGEKTSTQQRPYRDNRGNR